MKKTLLKGLALAVVGTAFAASSALAVPALYFDDGVSVPLIVTDGGAGDADATAGIVSFSGGFGAWVISASGTGFTKPVIGSASRPEIDLLSAVVSGGSGTFLMAFTDTGFGPVAGDIGGFLTEIGGTTDGTVSASSFFDGSNAPFGTATLIGSLGPFSGGAFSGSVQYNGLPGSNPFSLTLGTWITHTSSQLGDITTFDAHLTPVPEPATMMLVGTGLAGLAGAARRRKKSA